MSNNFFASLGEKKEKQKQKVEGGLQWNSFREQKQKLVHVCHWQLEEKLRGRSQWILGFSCNFRFANLILSWYQHVVGRTMQPEPAGNQRLSFLNSNKTDACDITSRHFCKFVKFGTTVGTRRIERAVEILPCDWHFTSNFQSALPQTSLNKPTDPRAANPVQIASNDKVWHTKSSAAQQGRVEINNKSYRL